MPALFPLKSSPPDPVPVETSEDQVDWSKELTQTQTIVQWNNGRKEPPLILLHPAGGTIHQFLHFEQEFKTNIWAVQITPDTPKNSLYDHARFYFQKIMEQQPQGPYRLASYSGSSMIMIPLAQMLQAAGGTIIQLAFIDHFPLLLLCPGIGLHIKENQPLDFGPAGRRDFLTICFDGACRMLLRTDGGNVVRRHRHALDLRAAFNGHPDSELASRLYNNLEDLVNASFDFIISLLKTGDATRLLDSFVGWIESVNAPITVYVASKGMLPLMMPEYSEQWADLGANFCHNKSRVVYLDTDHFDVIYDKRLILDLQRDYLPVEANL